MDLIASATVDIIARESILMRKHNCKCHNSFMNMKASLRVGTSATELARIFFDLECYPQRVFWHRHIFCHRFKALKSALSLLAPNQPCIEPKSCSARLSTHLPPARRTSPCAVSGPAPAALRAVFAGGQCRPACRRGVRQCNSSSTY